MKSSSPASGPDDDGYWPVTEILEESGAQYKVLWGGKDPDTGEPWPSTWVPKSDCTDRLVSKWRAKLKRGKEGPAGPAASAMNGGSSETTSRLGAKRKRQPNDSAGSDGCDDLQSAENLNSKKEPLLSLGKVGPPRGIPKKRSGMVSGSPLQEAGVPQGGSGNVSGPGEATNGVTANRKRRCEGLAGGCKGPVEAQSAKDFDGAKQEFSLGFHSTKVGPPRVAKKRSGIASGGHLLGEDDPGPRSASESIETALKRPADLKSKRKRQSEEPMDGCGDLEDLEKVKAKFGKQEAEKRRFTSASPFEPPLAKPASPASCDIHREKPGFQRGSLSSAAAESKSTNAGAEADQLQPENLRAPNSSGTPDFPQLLAAKVEEIKQLQCAISMNSNAAMKLSIEVMEALDDFKRTGRRIVVEKS